MHQAHNIPWHLIEANFKFVLDSKQYTPQRSGFFPKDRPQAPKELKHFIKKFIDAVTTFSTTERQKYQKKFTPQTTGNVFSDDLLAKYPQFLSKEVQSIEFWIKRFETGSYNGDLMNVVNVLLAENEMETLIMLAQHPTIHMSTLHYYSWGHHFGFCRAKEAALASYLFFNSAEAVGVLENGKYVQDSTYGSLVGVLTHSMDYCAQQVPHLRFFGEVGVLNKDSRETVVHKDYARLQAYLKELFAVLYRYDMLVRECGIDPQWEGEIGYCYPLRGHVELRWDEDAAKNVLVLPASSLESRHLQYTPRRLRRQVGSAHNIPWHLVEANFKFIQNDTPHHDIFSIWPTSRSALCLKDDARRPQAAKELKHLIKKLVATITSFSVTARQKYPAHFTPQSSGRVFSDALLEKYPTFLTKRAQSIEWWFKCFEGTHPYGSYNDLNLAIELMTAVAILIMENEMETLLMLAHHPKIRLSALHSYVDMYHRGWARLKDDALSSYIFFNSAAATGMIETGEYMLDEKYRFLSNILTSPGYTHQIPHCRFFYDANDPVGKAPLDGSVPLIGDYNRLHEYLKDLFALLYRCDMLEKECGIDSLWEHEAVECYPLRPYVEVKPTSYHPCYLVNFQYRDTWHARLAVERRIASKLGIRSPLNRTYLNSPGLDLNMHLIAIDTSINNDSYQQASKQVLKFVVSADIDGASCAKFTGAKLLLLAYAIRINSVAQTPKRLQFTLEITGRVSGTENLGGAGRCHIVSEYYPTFAATNFEARRGEGGYKEGAERLIRRCLLDPALFGRHIQCARTSIMQKAAHSRSFFAALALVIVLCPFSDAAALSSKSSSTSTTYTKSTSITYTNTSPTSPTYTISDPTYTISDPYPTYTYPTYTISDPYPTYTYPTYTISDPYPTYTWPTISDPYPTYTFPTDSSSSSSTAWSTPTGSPTTCLDGYSTSSTSSSSSRLF
ncbi:hypothetical protein BDN70DRAFT_921468 [Pholiota conissans]|uniref:Uncharacterized protein n=1 Tax=Pholiota conissans TaxID=109636 RepID=A0A9P5Z0D2_9AGAR|nr:hypothetical protein BDN70DRAFT_921468 [Pholiota conissans]